MRRRVVGAEVRRDDLAEILSPRDGVILESPPERAVPERKAPAPERRASEPDRSADPSGTYRFGLREGPPAAYKRTVVVRRGDDPDCWRVDQDVSLRIGLPYVSWLFTVPLLLNVRNLRPGGRSPWWAPPHRLNHDDGVLLATLCALSVLGGYLGDLLPTVMTYVGRHFDVGTGGQSVALGIVELNALVAMVLLVRADRSGRRRLIVACTAGAAVVTGACALSPSFAVLTGAQLAAAALLTAQGVLLGIVAVEEMPAGDRAWSLALVSMSYALGGGGPLAALPLAGLGGNGWRWLFAIGIIALPATFLCARRLPESRRWRQEIGLVEVRKGFGDLGPTARRWLLIIGAGAFLFALFSAPGSELQNQYLRTERHWSATRIGVSEQIVGTVCGLGTLVGGRLADTRGRRPVAALAVGLGSAATLLLYLTHGRALYGWMTVGSFFGYAVGPALAVYGAELFPTLVRGRVGGLLTIVAALGGFVGLAATGGLSDLIGTIGPALAIMAVGPAALVVLILVAYPETAGRTLEDINGPPATPPPAPPPPHPAPADRDPPPATRSSPERESP